MKRVVVILGLLILVAISILYFGISSTQSFSRSIVTGCTQQGAMRVLIAERNSKQGWPGKKLNDSTYLFEDLQYTTGSTMINGTGLSFLENGITSAGELITEETTPDSCRFTITASTKLPLNPVERVKVYFNQNHLKQTIDALLAAFESKFKDEEIIYGIKISIGRVQDSTMISTRKMMNHYPFVTEVYEMIDGITKHVQANGGETSNAPIMNVFEEDKNQFLVMVAIPTKNVVAANETYLLKRMLPNGFILMSEVTGGNYTIEQAEASMKQYVLDHHKSSPAIPFQMLLTDRRVETDTSKWKTRLYYPVMY